MRFTWPAVAPNEIKEEAYAQLRKFMADTEAGKAVVDGRLRYAILRQALIDDYVRKGNRSLEMRADGTETVVGLPQLDEAAGYKPAKDGALEQLGMLISAMTTEWTRQFGRNRKADGVGPAMINRSLQCLRRAMNILREEGKISHVPVIRLHKEPPARQGFMTPEKFEELLKALPTYLRAYIALLYFSGVRKSEALAVDWTQVDLDAHEIRLTPEQCKSDEGRVLPLHSRVVDLLRQQEPKVGKVFDASNLRTEWETACAAVGLGTRTKVTGPAGYSWHKYHGTRLHDMRRSAVRNMRVLGRVPEGVAMKISGHRTRAVFERYNIVITDDLHTAMQAVEQATMALPAVANGKTAPKKPSVQIRVQSGSRKPPKSIKPA